MKYTRALMLLLVLAACGDEPSEPSEPVNVTGTWSSNATFDDGFPFVYVLTLAQSGQTVNGTAQFLNVATGNVTGTVQGNRLTYEVTFSPTQCQGTLSGTATFSGRRVSGTLEGTTQCMGYTRVEHDGLKQGQN